MDLVAKGHIRPIAPLTVFQFEEIDAAFHFLRQGSHVGKVVISSGDDRVVNVEVCEILCCEATLILVGTSCNARGGLAERWVIFDRGRPQGVVWQSRNLHGTTWGETPCYNVSIRIRG